MVKTDLKLGAKVVCKRSNRMGVVVIDSLRSCGSEDVLVEFDNILGVFAISCGDLEFLEMVSPQINLSLCRDCAFCNGACCLRYSMGRLGMLLSGSNGKRIPTRIYPFCQSKKAL